MPIGSYSVIPHVGYQISLRKNVIKTVLDVGIGFGMNGVIVRQYLDDGVLPFSVWLDGVEAFAKYRNPLWAMYNHIWTQPLENVDFGVKTYECIIMTDVIEHFNKSHGVLQLERLKKMLSQNGIFIVSTPSVFVQQGAAHGNIYETHRSLWTCKDFEDLGFKILKNGSCDEFGNYMICAMYEHR